MSLRFDCSRLDWGETEQVKMEIGTKNMFVPCSKGKKKRAWVESRGETSRRATRPTRRHHQNGNQFLNAVRKPKALNVLERSLTYTYKQVEPTSSSRVWRVMNEDESLNHLNILKWCIGKVCTSNRSNQTFFCSHMNLYGQVSIGVEIRR